MPVLIHQFCNRHRTIMSGETYHPCAVCAFPADKRCGRCRKEWYCSKEDQTQVYRLFEILPSCMSLTQRHGEKRKVCAKISNRKSPQSLKFVDARLPEPPTFTPTRSKGCSRLIKLQMNVHTWSQGYYWCSTGYRPEPKA